jgi:hypothetical protein
MSHLQEANQTYFQHFKDSIGYSFTSLKCSFYFAVHAFFPGMCQSSGSTAVKELNETLQKKLLSR